MTACPFCEIIAGNAPATFVAAWDDAIAIRPLRPAAPEHTLVIPRVHVPDISTDRAVSNAMMAHAVDLAIERGGALNIITSKGAEASQTVFHLHVHVLPRSADDGINLWLRAPTN